LATPAAVVVVVIVGLIVGGIAPPLWLMDMESLLDGGVDGGGVDAAEEVVEGVFDLGELVLLLLLVVGRCCCCKRGMGSLA